MNKKEAELINKINDCNNTMHTITTRLSHCKEDVVKNSSKINIYMNTISELFDTEVIDNILSPIVATLQEVLINQKAIAAICRDNYLKELKGE